MLNINRAIREHDKHLVELAADLRFMKHDKLADYLASVPKRADEFGYLMGKAVELSIKYTKEVSDKIGLAIKYARGNI